MSPQIGTILGEARAYAAQVPLRRLYEDRLRECELDLAIAGALWTPAARGLALERFGSARTLVPVQETQCPALQVAEDILAGRSPLTLADTPRRPELGERTACLRTLLLRMAATVGLAIDVRLDPDQSAMAASGERIVVVRSTAVPLRQGLRLAVHEVLGHLTAAANGRAQPLRLLEVGTAGSFADQEGLALWLEEEAGLLDARRLRTLAARVLVAARVQDGACFSDVATELVRNHAFDAEEAVVLSERGFRGGGVARDHGYFIGWCQVRHALRHGGATLSELRAGRMSLAAIGDFRTMIEQGWARPARYRPSLSRSLAATVRGTNFETSPPSAAASLTRFELT